MVCGWGRIFCEVRRLISRRQNKIIDNGVEVRSTELTGKGKRLLKKERIRGGICP